MKNIHALLLIFTLAIIGVSCENDGGTAIIPLEKGIVPTFQKTAGSVNFLDLGKINSGDNIAIEFSADLGLSDNPKPIQTDIVGFYRPSAGSLYTATLFSNVSLPQNFTMTISNLVDAFSEINSADDILVGDVLTITARFTRADGTILNIINDDGSNNTSSSLLTTPHITTTINYPVSCPSDLGGTHSYVSSNLQAAYGYGCPSGEITGTVTWTDQGGGSYLVSDLGFGQYGTSCWGDSPATSSGAIITEVCGKIISGGLDQYGLTYIWVITNVNGSELSLSWSNDYGDSGDVVLTREGGEDWPPLFTE